MIKEKSPEVQQERGYVKIREFEGFVLIVAVEPDGSVNMNESEVCSRSHAKKKKKKKKKR